MAPRQKPSSYSNPGELPIDEMDYHDSQEDFVEYDLPAEIPTEESDDAQYEYDQLQEELETCPEPGDVPRAEEEQGPTEELDVPESEIRFTEPEEQTTRMEEDPNIELYTYDDSDEGNDDVFFCPKCNHIISRDANQCPKCGMPFSDKIEDDLDELIKADLEDVFVEDSNILTEDDLSSMEDNLQRLAELETKPASDKRKAVKECVVCGAMLFEGYTTCPVCGEDTGVK